MVDLKKKKPFVWFNMARDEGQPLVARLATSWPKKIALPSCSLRNSWGWLVASLITWLRIPTGRRWTSWLFYIQAWQKIWALVYQEQIQLEHKLGVPGLQVQNPIRSAMLPHTGFECTAHQGKVWKPQIGHFSFNVFHLLFIVYSGSA